MVLINHDKCIGCGLCAQDCVGINIRIENGKAEIKKECIECGHCVAICPANAVTIPEYDMEDVEEYQEETFKLNPENVLHAIKFRRSMRDFKAEKIAEEHLKMIMQAGRYTATAKNNQGCTFVFVQEEVETLKEKVWNAIDNKIESEGKNLPKEFLQFAAFSRLRKKGTDFLFRNAPAVLFITSDWALDAGLAAQNMETMAVSLGVGALYNGFLAGIINNFQEIKEWLGIGGKEIKACMLLGYPARKYKRTAPRREANVIWK